MLTCLASKFSQQNCFLALEKGWLRDIVNQSIWKAQTAPLLPETSVFPFIEGIISSVIFAEKLLSVSDYLKFISIYSLCTSVNSSQNY